MRELEGCLTGQILKFYRIVTQTDPMVTYEDLKEYLKGRVRKEKRSARHVTKDNFEKAKMASSETLEDYAYRLEALALLKFGNINVDDCKPLLLKFIDTVPTPVREYLRRKRKEMKHYTGHRLKWSKVLDDIVDGQIPGAQEHGPVSFGKSDAKGEDQVQEYSSVPEAVKAYLPEVMRAFVQDQYGNGSNKSTRQENQPRGRSKSLRDNGAGTRSRSQSRGSSGRPGSSGDSSNTSSPRGGGQRRNTPKCFGCGKLGHMVRDCRLKGGECFKCGKHGHLQCNCSGRIVHCSRCGVDGHVARICPAPQPLAPGSGTSAQQPQPQRHQWASATGATSQGKGSSPSSENVQG